MIVLKKQYGCFIVNEHLEVDEQSLKVIWFIQLGAKSNHEDRRLCGEKNISGKRKFSESPTSSAEAAEWYNK